MSAVVFTSNKIGHFRLVQDGDFSETTPLRETPVAIVAVVLTSPQLGKIKLRDVEAMILAQGHPAE